MFLIRLDKLQWQQFLCKVINNLDFYAHACWEELSIQNVKHSLKQKKVRTHCWIVKGLEFKVCVVKIAESQTTRVSQESGSAAWITNTADFVNVRGGGYDVSLFRSNLSFDNSLCSSKSSLYKFWFLATFLLNCETNIFVGWSSYLVKAIPKIV